MDSVARTALSRSGTALVSSRLRLCVPAHTTPAVAYDCVQRGYKVGHDGVGIVQAGEDRDDVGARVGVLLGQSSI